MLRSGRWRRLRFSPAARKRLGHGQPAVSLPKIEAEVAPSTPCGPHVQMLLACRLLSRLRRLCHFSIEPDLQEWVVPLKISAYRL